MPSFRPPQLDDRSYDDLRRELVRRIPVHSPEWTDHNPSDPGIALLEVFAWLGENLLYRLNRVPEKAQAEFLNLLGVSRRPARPARTFVRVDLGAKDKDPVLLQAGPTAPRTVVTAGKVRFQVLDELEVLPLEALPAVKVEVPSGVAVQDVGLLLNVLSDHLGSDAPDAESELQKYQTRLLPAPKDGVPPEPTAVGLTADGVLWIGLLVPEGLARANPAVTPADLKPKLAGRVLSVGFRLDSTLCGPEDVERCPAPGAASTPLPVIWQVSTGRFMGSEARIDQIRYARVAVEADGTAGLTRSGVWRLRLPLSVDDLGTWDESSGLDPELLGVGALPPLLEDEKLAGRVVAWLRCFRPKPAEGESLPQPSVRWVDVNAVEVEQAVTAQPELLGYGTGRPAQVVRLAQVPVLGDSLLLEVNEPGGWVTWRRVEHFAGSRADDPHYVLEPVTGEVRFGDGIRGRMPRVGEVIRARTYRTGGGVQGNVPAGAISKIQPPPGTGALRVTQPLAAEGGVDEETEEAAKARIPQVLRHNERAVASEDFKDLALETPGAGLGRVEVLPRHKPQERVDGVPGVVTLIVIPAEDALHPDEPVPDRETLRKVCAWLEPRRLVTTELYVTPPEYVPVWISVAFEVEEGYGVQTVRRWVELAIRQHFAPLPPYGPAGQGWPFGRKVAGPDVEAAVLRVEGVRLVNGVLVEGPPPEDGSSADTSNIVELQSWQLPVIKGVQLTQVATPEPIERDGDAARAPGEDGTPRLPVPVIEEVCE